MDNDNDVKIDFPEDESCLSPDDDNEGTNNCGYEIDTKYDNSCSQDDEDDEIEIKIKNNNSQGLSHVSFSLPLGVVPVSPRAGDIYQGLQGKYNVEITNNPFYSIKFNTLGEDGFKNGEEEIFILTFLPEDYDKIKDIKVQSKSGLILGNVTFIIQ